MKTGVIIYITGNLPVGWDEDISDMIHRLDIQEDAVEVVISDFGSDDIHFAWWKLMTKGMQGIICKLARFDSSMNLRLTGKELRLCG